MNEPAQPGYTELTIQVVREAEEPLPFDEILRRVDALRPISTKNPKSTIRNIISQSRLIISTGDHRYGWKQRLMTGAVLRFTLTENDIRGPHVAIGEEHREALVPAFFTSPMRYNDHGPVTMQLPDDTTHTLELDMITRGFWGLVTPPAFTTWLKTHNPAVGDHLILTVVDGIRRHYALRFEPRSSRDEPAIAERNQVIIRTALQLVRSRPRGTTIWELCELLLARGFYHEPTPPDTLKEIWTPDLWEPLVTAMGLGPHWPLAAHPTAYDQTREQEWDTVTELLTRLSETESKTPVPPATRAAGSHHTASISMPTPLRQAGEPITPGFPGGPARLPDLRRGVLTLWSYGAPAPVGLPPKQPPPARQLMRYLPVRPHQNCPCGSGAPFRDCCRRLPYAHPLTPAPGMAHYSLIVPSEARCTVAEVNALGAWLDAHRAFSLISESIRRSVWRYWGEQPYHAPEGPIFFCDIELLDQSVLLLNALSRPAMRAMLCLQEVSRDWLTAPRLSLEPIPVVDKQTGRQGTVAPDTERKQR